MNAAGGWGGRGGTWGRGRSRPGCPTADGMVMRADFTDHVAGFTRPASSAADYVLPAPPRGRRDQLLVTPAPAQEQERSGRCDARSAGVNLQLHAECLDGLLDELRERVEELGAATATDPHRPLRGALRGLSQVLERCRAVQQDITAESARLSSGEAAVDLAEVCKQVACARGPREAVVVSGHAAATCWGDRASVRRLLEVALDLVWARTGEQAPRRLEVIGGADGPAVRVCSDGEPRGEMDPELVDAFRAAATRASARVHPDALGRGGAGLVLNWRK